MIPAWQSYAINSIYCIGKSNPVQWKLCQANETIDLISNLRYEESWIDNCPVITQ